MAPIFLKKIKLKQKLFFLAFVISITCQSVHGQYKYGDIDHYAYESNLGKYLLPDTNTSDVKVIIELMEIPSFKSEYAIRIVRQSNQFIFEGRFFKKSYWGELSSNVRLKKYVNFEPEVLFRSVYIGDVFEKKLEAAFCNTIVKLSDNNRNYQDLDGTEYKLRLNDGEKRTEKLVSNPREGDIGHVLIMLFTRMASDLKNQTFDELKYKLNKE